VPQSEWGMRRIETVMDVKAPALRATQNAGALELLLTKSAYPAIPILDEDGKLLGVAALADLHRARGGLAGGAL
jgi:CBS-domain-containing membrane protein